MKDKHLVILLITLITLKCSNFGIAAHNQKYVVNWIAEVELEFEVGLGVGLAVPNLSPLLDSMFDQ
jgi:hypothetical protein